VPKAYLLKRRWHAVPYSPGQLSEAHLQDIQNSSPIIRERSAVTADTIRSAIMRGQDRRRQGFEAFQRQIDDDAGKELRRSRDHPC
jgi:hypothetical protein